MTTEATLQLAGHEILVDPRDGLPLRTGSGGLHAASGDQAYPIDDGIIDLLVREELDEAARHEMAAFAENPVIGVPYFRRSLFRDVARRALEMIANEAGAITCAEMGGGEGYFARALAEACPSANVFVCDVCRRYLELAPQRLERVWCDARRPVFRQASVDLMAYWVSLHHFSRADARTCLERAYDALRPGGVLVIFEPNDRFFLRRLLMSLPLLRSKVYFDEEEKHLDPTQVVATCQDIGFEHVASAACNPPYAREFLRKLTWGRIFGAATEVLHVCDRAGMSTLLNRSAECLGIRGAWGLYFLLLLRKP